MLSLVFILVLVCGPVRKLEGDVVFKSLIFYDTARSKVETSDAISVRCIASIIVTCSACFLVCF